MESQIALEVVICEFVVDILKRGQVPAFFCLFFLTFAAAFLKKMPKKRFYGS